MSIGLPREARWVRMAIFPQLLPGVSRRVVNADKIQANIFKITLFRVGFNFPSNNMLAIGLYHSSQDVYHKTVQKQKNTART